MDKKIEIILPKRNVKAVAKLLENDSPKTCEAVWKLLKIPIESKAIHAMSAGREIYCEIPFIGKVPPESLRVTPLPGEILFLHYPPYTQAGMPKGFTELAFFYGRDSRCYTIGMGDTPGNHFATIIENLGEFAKACDNLHIEGSEKIIVKRK